MLVVVTTDADVSAADLGSALAFATRTTFDRVDVDGCMSTNDTVLLMASGVSGVVLHPESTDWPDFVTALTDVCADLSRQLAADAEGASKLITVEVTGAASEDDAVEVARAVARSALLKCAIHGEDANWGRVLAAVGTTTATFDPEAIDVSFNGVRICAQSVEVGDRESAAAALKPRDVTISIELHAGDSGASVLTSDLTAAYVHENSAYST
jgi:glutamate N-acetyltransferase/amino-acid N-acetyltransferase